MKKASLIFTVGLCLVCLAGCSNKVEYTGNNFEDVIGYNITIANNMNSKLTSALQGNFYEDVSGEISDVKNTVATAREPGQKALPNIVRDNEEYNGKNKNGTFIDRQYEYYLDDEYIVDRYASSNSTVAAYVYQIEFTGTKTDVLDKYIRYIAKIENEFGETYGDAQFSNTNFTTLEEINENNKYTAVYKVGDYYLASIGYYSTHNEKVVHKLTFINKNVTHLFASEYKEALIPFDKMIDARNVPSDFSLVISYTNKSSGIVVNSNEIIPPTQDDETTNKTQDEDIIIDQTPEQSTDKENSEEIDTDSEQTEESDNNEPSDEESEDSDDVIIIVG